MPAVILAAAALWVVPRVAKAQTTYTWDPKGVSGASDQTGTEDWDTSSLRWYTTLANQIWQNVDSASANNAVFGAGGSSSYTVTLNSAIDVGTMTFQSMAGGGNYTVTANTTDTLTMFGGITLNSGSGAVTVGSSSGTGVIFGAANTWTNISSNLLTVSSPITSSTYGLMVAGSGNTTITGTFNTVSTQGAGALTMAGTGILTLSSGGTNYFTGGLNIESGTVVEGNNQSGLGSGTITIGNIISNSATPTLNFNSGSAYSTTFAEPINVVGASNNTLSASGNNPVFSNTVTLGSGSLATASNLTIGSNNPGGSYFTFNGAVQGYGNLTISMDGTGNANNYVNFAGGVNTNGTITFNNALYTGGGSVGGSGNTGTNIIGTGVGSGVTMITQGSNTNPLSITGAIAVNSTATTLASSGTASFTVSGGSTGTGGLIFENGISNAAGVILKTAGLSNQASGNQAVSIGSGTFAGTVLISASGSYSMGSSSGGTASLAIGGTTGIGTLGFANSETTPTTLTVYNSSGNTGLTLGGSASGAAALNFNYSATGTDQINTGGQLAVNPGGAVINFALMSGATSPLAAGTYPLLTYANSSVPSGITLGTTPVNTFDTLNVSATSVTLTVVAGTTGNAYWGGGVDGAWNTSPGGTTNWLSSTGANSLLPISTTNVFETVAGGGSQLVQTLGQSFTVNSLNFNNPFAVAIGPGSVSTNSITIEAGTSNSNPTSNGITVAAGSGPATVTAPITLGASQTWTNNSTNPLTVGGAVNLGTNVLTIGSTCPMVLSGNISGTGVGNSLTIGNSSLSTVQVGAVTLSGTNSYTGNTYLYGHGVLLNIDSSTALGSSTLAFNGVTTPNIAIDSPISNLTLTNAVTNGFFEFIGTHNLAFGAFNITGNSTNVINNGTLQFNGVATNSATGSTAIYLQFSGPNATVTAGNLILNNGLVLSATGATYSAFEIFGLDNTTVNGVVSNGGATTPPGLTFGNYVGGTTNNGSTPTTTLFLTGLNTYTGTTTIAGGILSTGASGTLAITGSPSSIGASGNISIGGGGDNGQGGTLQYANALAGSANNESTNVQITFGGTGDTGGYTNYVDASGANQITFSNTAAVQYGVTGFNYGIVLTGKGTGVFDPAIVNDGSGLVALTKQGTGSWTLGAAESYTGITTIDAGTLTLASGATLASGSLTLNLNGGTFADDTGGTQTFSTTNLHLGGSGLAASNGSTLGVAAFTRAAGATLAFTLGSGSTINVGSTAVNNGILGGWAVVNGTNWATTSGGNVVAFTTYSGALPASGGTSTSNYSLVGPLAGNVQTQSGGVSAYTLNIADTTSGDTLSLGSNLLTFGSTSSIATGGLFYSGGQAFNITGTGYIGAGAGNEFIVTVGSGTLNFSAPLIGSAGAGSLTVAGAGTLVLNNGSSNYTGTTYVGSGTLKLGVSSTTTGSGATLALSTGPTGKGPLFVNGNGILDLNGNNLAVSGVTSYTAGSAGTIANSSTSAGGTLSIVTSGSAIYIGAIADATGSGSQKTSVVIAGSGTQTFSGQSTYSGGTTIYSGTVVAGLSSLANSSGALSSGPLGTGAVTAYGGTLQLNSTNVNNVQGETVLANNIVLNGTLTLSTNGSTNGSTDANTFAGQISGSGGITTTGSATYIQLSNPNNTFTGTLTNSSGGAVIISAVGALPSGDNVNLTGTGAALLLAQPDASQAIGGLSASSSGNVIKLIGSTAGVFNLSVGLNTTASSTYTFAGVISSANGAIALTKVGPDTQVLTGGNTYANNTTIDAGTLELNGSGTTVVIPTTSPLVLGGGTLDDVGPSTAAEGFASTTVFAGASSVINNAAGHTDALGPFSRNVGGTVNFDATNTASTGAGSITTTTANTSGILGGWAVFNGVEWAMAVTGTTNYIAPYTAGSSISGTGNLLASSTANYVVTANATDQESAPVANSIQFGNTSAATSLSLTNTLVISSGGILVPSTVTSATSITGSAVEGRVGATSATDLIVNQYSASPLTISSAIANNSSSANGLTISGPGTTILAGTNTYTGGTFLNSGTLQVGGGGSTGTLGSGPVADGGILAFDRSDIGLVAGNVISGSGSVQQTISGAGAVTLGSANSYTGGTTISAGMLRVANTSGSATGSGAVAVNSGGTLAGSTAAGQGFISGIVTVAGGGTLSAGNTTAAATLTLSGGLTLNADSTANLALNSSSPNGTSNPLVNVAGAMAVAGASTVNVSFSGISPIGTYDLFGYGSLTGFSNLAVTGPGGFVYSLVNNTAGSQVDLNVISGALTWGGQNGSTWDTSTANWYTVVPSSTSFTTAAPVSFYDAQYTGGPTVTNSSIAVSGSVSPASVNFYNTAGGVAYTITTTVGSNGIAGSTGITLIGTGTVTLVGPNTYTGATTLDAGTLVIGNVNSIGRAIAPLVFNGGTLQFAPSSTTTDISSGRTVTISSSGGTIDLNGNSVSLGSSIGNSGSGALTVVDSGSGPDTLTLSGSNTFSGGVNLNGGIVNFSTFNNLGTGAISFNGGTLQWSGSNTLDISSRTVTIGSSGATLDINGNNVTLANAIGGAGGLTMINSGAAATLTLAAANTYGGATNVNAGTLQVVNTTGSATGPTGLVTVANGAALAGGGSGAAGAIAGSVNIMAGATIAPSGGGNAATASSSTGTLTVGNLTLNNGAASASQLNFQYNSSTPSADEIAVNNTLTLPAATNTNEVQFNFFAPGGTSNLVLPSGTSLTLITYTSLTNTFNPATLSINPADLSGGTKAVFSTSGNAIDLNIETIVTNASATWSSTGTSGTTSDFGTAANWSPATVPSGVGLIATFGAGGETSVSLSSSYTVGQLDFNNGGNSSAPNGYFLSASGTGSLTLNNSGTGASVNVSSGGLSSFLQPSLTLILADANLTTTFNIASGSSLDVAGPINQLGSDQQIVLTGGGILELDGGNSYDGGTMISAGTLKVGGPTALGASAGAVTVTGSGAALDLAGTTMTGANPLTLNGTGVSSGGALTNSSGNGGTYAGQVTLGSSGVSIGGAGTIALTATGTITGSGDNLTLAGAGGSVASVIGTGSGTLTANTTGTWLLSGANTYNGGTTVTAGTLQLSGSGTFGDGGLLTVSGGGADLSTVSLAGANSVNGISDGSSSSGTITSSSMSMTPSTLTVNLTGNSPAGNEAYSGALSGDLALIIASTGSGVQTISSGANSYSGGTTVNRGTLTITATSGTSALGSGPLAINGSSSTVNLTGAAITVGSLSGSGSGQLNIAPSATLTVNQSATSTFNGTLTLNGGFVLANASGNTLTISGAPTLGSSSSITVNSGTLALTNNTNSSANVAGTPTVSVAPGATLQLAGSSNVLSRAVNITTHGSGIASDGALTVVVASMQTIGVVTGDAQAGDVTTYSGNTTVGDGASTANLTATQILQNTLTINAGSTVTIAPSGSGIPTDAVAATAATSSVATSDSTAGSDSNSDPFTAIQAAIDSGAISSAKGQQLENRIAAIERLAATDPGLDVSLLEDRVLAALPTPSVWSSSGSPSTAPLGETGSGLLAADNGESESFSATSPSAAAAFAPNVALGGSPAAVPEPSTLLLAALGSVGILIAVRRRKILDHRTVAVAGLSSTNWGAIRRRDRFPAGSLSERRGPRGN